MNYPPPGGYPPSPYPPYYPQGPQYGQPPIPAQAPPVPPGYGQTPQPQEGPPPVPPPQGQQGYPCQPPQIGAPQGYTPTTPMPQPPYGYPGGWAAPAYVPVYQASRLPDPRRKGASTTLNRMCLLLLAQVALSFVWQIPLQMLLGVLGVDILSNELAYQWLSAVLVPLSTALPFVAYLIFRREDPAGYLKFEKVGFSGGLLCVLAGLAIVLLGNYPALFVSDLLGFFGYHSAPGYVSSAETLPVILLEIAVTAVLVPVMEELVFRGVVLSSLRRYGIGFSIVASALVFGMAHLDISTMVFATIAGLVFGFLYARTNNLWLTVLIHGLNNLIAVVGSHTSFFFGDMANLVDALLVLVPIGLGLIALVIVLLRKRDMFIGVRSPRYDGPAQPLRAGESASAIVRAPVFWGVVGLMAVYTLGMGFLL